MDLFCLYPPFLPLSPPVVHFQLLACHNQSKKRSPTRDMIALPASRGGAGSWSAAVRITVPKDAKTLHFVFLVRRTRGAESFVLVFGFFVQPTVGPCVLVRASMKPCYRASIVVDLRETFLFFFFFSLFCQGRIAPTYPLRHNPPHSLVVLSVRVNPL